MPDRSRDLRCVYSEIASLCTSLLHVDICSALTDVSFEKEKMSEFGQWDFSSSGLAGFARFSGNRLLPDEDGKEHIRQRRPPRSLRTLLTYVWGRLFPARLLSPRSICHCVIIDFFLLEPGDLS